MAIDDTTTWAGTDLDQAQSAAMSTLVERRPGVTAMMNRNWETLARMAEWVSIDNLHPEVDGNAANTVPIEDRPLAKYKDDFQTPKEASVSHQIFKIDQGGEDSVKFYDRQIRKSGARGRGRINATVRQMQVNKLKDRDDNLLAYLAALATYTTDAPAAADLPKLDDTGKNGNAGAIHKATFGAKGANGEFLNWQTGEPAAHGTGSVTDTIDRLFSMMEALTLRLQETDVVGGEAITGETGMFNLLVSPRVLRGFRTATRKAKLFTDSLNIRLYENFTMFANERDRDRLMGLNLIADNGVPNPTAKGNPFVSYLMTPQAVTFAEEVPMFWSQTSKANGGVNSGPYTSWHQIYEYGRKLVNANQIIRVEFAADDPAAPSTETVEDPAEDTAEDTADVSEVSEQD